MKYIISQSQYNFLTEQQNKTFVDPNKLQPQKPTSDYLGKGGQFEKQLYGGLDAVKYAEILKNKKPSEIKKVRLIFPIKNWERIALEFLQKLGVVTGIFSSLSSAINYVKNLTKKGVKADEFVVGSHGTAGQLLITNKRDNTYFDNSFLSSFKDILKPNSTVFFTACYGADYLDSLKDAAERLGVGAYGSSGIYNYITNKSEQGYYWCSAQKFNPPESGQSRKPWVFGRSLMFTIYWGPEESKMKDVKLPITLKIKDSVFNTKIEPIVTEMESPESVRSNISNVRDDSFLTDYTVNLNWGLYDRLTKPPFSGKDNQTNNPFTRKQNELKKQGKTMINYIYEKFMSDEIIVEVTLRGKPVNVKSLPPIKRLDKITNEFLLEKGYCKKVSKAPISWI